MGQLLSTGSCPHCRQGTNTPCYAEYTDGYKCYSCGASKSYNKEQQGFLPVTSALRRLDTSRLDLPDFVSDPRLFSLQLRRWLNQYYIYDEKIKLYNILAADNSLLFLSHKDGEIQFYQQRFFPNKKLINHGKKVVHRFTNNHKTVVLTEDYISAIRVHECNVDSWCLFGTSLGYADIGMLLDNYREIIVWLDNDKAGHDGTDKITYNLKARLAYFKRKYPYKYLHEYNIRVIKTSRDPKEYSPTEIERIIYDQTR